MIIEKIRICNAPNGISAIIAPKLNAEGLNIVYPTCFDKIGLPIIWTGNSANALNELKSRAMNNAPPRVKAPEEVWGMLRKSEPAMMAMRMDVL